MNPTLTQTVQPKLWIALDETANFDPLNWQALQKMVQRLEKSHNGDIGFKLGIGMLIFHSLARLKTLTKRPLMFDCNMTETPHNATSMIAMIAKNFTQHVVIIMNGLSDTKMILAAVVAAQNYDHVEVTFSTLGSNIDARSRGRISKPFTGDTNDNSPPKTEISKFKTLKRKKRKAQKVTIIHALAQQDNIGQQVLSLAEIARRYGATSILCSAQDIKPIRGNLKDVHVMVTSVRQGKAAMDDHKRVLSPADIVAANGGLNTGVSMIVGRPIVGAKNPAAMAKKYLSEFTKTGKAKKLKKAA